MVRLRTYVEVRRTELAHGLAVNALSKPRAAQGLLGREVICEMKVQTVV